MANSIISDLHEWLLDRQSLFLWLKAWVSAQRHHMQVVVIRAWAHVLVVLMVKVASLRFLHPNETVIDHSKGQSMGGSPINVTLNISTGVAQTVRTEIQSMLPMITNATKAAIVDAKQRGGSFARAMS